MDEAPQQQASINEMKKREFVLQVKHLETDTNEYEHSRNHNQNFNQQSLDLNQITQSPLNLPQSLPLPPALPYLPQEIKYHIFTYLSDYTKTPEKVPILLVCRWVFDLFIKRMYRHIVITKSQHYTTLFGLSDDYTYFENLDLQGFQDYYAPQEARRRKCLSYTRSLSLEAAPPRNFQIASFFRLRRFGLYDARVNPLKNLRLFKMTTTSCSIGYQPKPGQALFSETASGEDGDDFEYLGGEEVIKKSDIKIGIPLVKLVANIKHFQVICNNDPKSINNPTPIFNDRSGQWAMRDWVNLESYTCIGGDFRFSSVIRPHEFLLDHGLLEGLPEVITHYGRALPTDLPNLTSITFTSHPLSWANRSEIEAFFTSVARYGQSPLITAINVSSDKWDAGGPNTKEYVQSLLDMQIAIWEQAAEEGLLGTHLMGFSKIRLVEEK